MPVTIWKCAVQATLKSRLVACINKRKVGEKDTGWLEIVYEEKREIVWFEPGVVTL